MPSLCEARIALCEREGTIPKYVGYWPTRDEAADEISGLIGNWAKQRKLEGVVWTALPPKWNEQNGVVPTIDQVLQHLRGQGADSKAEGYIRKAPMQVKTSYRASIEAELGWRAQE